MYYGPNETLLKSEVAPHLDPFQFAYRHRRSTEDAFISMTHLISKHLEVPHVFVRALFLDFSLAFNTAQPHLLVQKLINMQVNPFMIKWFYSFLTNRTQQVRINGSL